LKPGLTEARAQLAYYQVLVDWDIAAAERELGERLQRKKTIVLNTRALIRRARGDSPGAVPLQRRVIDSDPLWVTWYINLAATLVQVGQYDDAESALRKAMELQSGAQSIHSTFSLLALLRGQTDLALREAQLEPEGIWRDVYVALAQHARGDQAAADAALDKLIAAQGDNFQFRLHLSTPAVAKARSFSSGWTAPMPHASRSWRGMPSHILF